jgi:retron-type reverse transcriptase
MAAGRAGHKGEEGQQAGSEEAGMPGDASVNTGDPGLDLVFGEAERRVLGIQAKLHRWACDDPDRRFGDLFNLVTDPGFLLVAWVRVRGNKGAQTAGVDRRTADSIVTAGVAEFLGGLRSALRDRSFRPLPVRERMIPKRGGKLRRLGIATIADRVVQASLKLVLEPVFEADFLPCSYGFRPNRRAHDAVAEVRHLASRTRCYEWVVEGDIKACFDEISHNALQERVRARIADKRVLALVKAFLKAGILTEDGTLEETTAGTPQGSILTPPTQWIIRRMVTLRVRFGVATASAGAVSAGGDAVADGDLLRPDEDVFDQQPEYPLAIFYGGFGGAVAQPGQEAFQVIGELEVSIPVGGLGVEGVDLPAEVLLAGAQVRHLCPQLVDGDQLFGQGLDHGGDRGGGLGQRGLEAFALADDRGRWCGPARAACRSRRGSARGRRAGA